MAYQLGNDILRAEQLATALHESEERLGLAARSAGLGIWVLDPTNLTVWATDQTRALFGFRKDESLAYEQWTSRVHPDDLDGVLRKIDDSLTTDKDFEAEYRVPLPGGKMRWIAVHGRSEVGESGNPIVRGVIRDITNQKQTQEELDLLRRELAHTGRVTLLGQLNSALAHEIKQPLAAAQLNSALAQKLLRSDKPDLTQLREIQDDIERDVDRASQVIERLSILVKRRSLERRAIAVKELLDSVIALTHSESIARHVTLEVTVAPDAPTVLGDKVHLSQVLLNLIINAMDAVESLPDDRRRVAIEARPKDDMVEISVTDFGTGIAADLMDKLFDPFFTTKPNGMGMGLAISRTIVEVHGGRLWATNNARRGATFHLVLPVSA